MHYDAIDQWRKRLHACVRDILTMRCDSRTILINAANYRYHLIDTIYRFTQYRFQTIANFDISISHGWLYSNTFKVWWNST